MRLLGVLIAAAVIYFAVPLLWERAMVHRVAEISATRAGIPVGNAVEVNWAANENLMNGINSTLINQEEMNRFEQVGAQAAADEQMRQVQAAQDQAWKASHSDIP